MTEVPGTPGLADYVAAFYTSPAFRPERALLGLIARRRPMTPTRGAWPGRNRQLLGLDGRGPQRGPASHARRDRRHPLLVHGRARPRPGPHPAPLRLGRGAAPGTTRLGPMFHLLLGFHRLYSRALLASARRRLLRH
ncbi:MAG: hypothetical protein R3D85_06765 [Paracoccaceae bacterium]